MLQSIGAAFGHLDDPRCIPALHKLRHPDEDVRHSVVFGVLLGHDDDLPVDTLVELSSDPAEDVRDWATFGLGTRLDRDTEQVRATWWRAGGSPAGDFSAATEARPSPAMRITSPT